MSGSEIILNFLRHKQVNTVFGYPGGAIMPFYDVLESNSNIQHVLVRHEQGAAFAASGFARIHNTPGVCIATSGPGATNLITGITDAYLDGIPLFIITGQVPSHALGTDAFQEAPIPQMVKPITKYCVQITNPKELVEVLPHAWLKATSGRPGPVLIDITKDAQTAEINTTKIHWNEINQHIQTHTELPEIEQVIKTLKNAQKPLILFGHGIHIGKATQELKDLLDTCGIPSVATLHGLSATLSNQPNFLGMGGMHGYCAANIAIQEADVILALGMRFDDRFTGHINGFAPQAKIIHIDISKHQLNRVIQPFIAIHSDVKDILPRLTEKIPAKNYEDWISSLNTHKKVEQKKVLNVVYDKHNTKPTMALTLKSLDESRTRNPVIFVSDVGQHQMMAARYLHLKKEDRLLNSGGLGTMGFAVPASIGAYFANKQNDTEIVAIAGDGSFQMSLQELGTIAEQNIPLKILILNNGYLGMVRQWQDLFFKKRYSQVVIKSPTLKYIAKAYDFKYLSCNTTKNLQKTMSEFWSCDGPILCEVNVQEEENVFPIVPSGASLHEMQME